MAVSKGEAVSLLERVDDFVVGSIAFPLTNYTMNRRGVLRHYRELKRSEWYPQQRLQAIQLRRFRELIQYARQWCPFYTARFKDAGLRPEDIQTLDDVRKIPLLTRKDVMDHGRDMLDTRDWSSMPVADASTRGPGQPASWARFRKHKLVKNTSSGSTGAPVTFYEDGAVTGRNWSLELRVKAWFGHKPGVREARLVRVSTDYLPQSKALLARQYLWHQLILPGVNLTDREHALSVAKIQAFRPKILWGFTSALTGLADYVRRSNIDVSSWRPALAISWAGPLYDHEKALLSGVFQCAQTNIYGSREVGHVAFLCPAGSLHVNQEDLLVESVRDGTNGAPEPLGELVVTALDAVPMPFIRYRMGDIGEVAPSQCACGRSLVVIKDLLGRTGEVFFTRDGRMLAPNFWMRTFMVGRQSQTIERWQVHYRKDRSIQLRLVPRPTFSPDTEADLRRHLEKNLSTATPVDFEYVAQIDRHPSGKDMLIINDATDP
jgi:phenylacetate-CoA ligase